MLTGAAKEDFEFYFKNAFKYIEFDDLPVVCKASIIVNWFDSVGIYVNVLKYGYKWKVVVYTQFRTAYKTRIEATTKAIEKANEIYNQLKKQL